MFLCFRICSLKICFCWPDPNIGCSLIFWPNDSFLKIFCSETSARDTNFNLKCSLVSTLLNFSQIFLFTSFVNSFKEALIPRSSYSHFHWKMPQFLEQLLFSVNIDFSFWKGLKQLILYKTEISTFEYSKFFSWCTVMNIILDVEDLKKLFLC